MTTNRVRLAVASTFLLGGLAVAQLPKVVRVIDSPGATRCVDVSHDGKLVAAGGDNCKVFVWDAQTGKRLFELDEGKFSVFRVRFANSGKTVVVSCGYKPAPERHYIGRLTWWDLKTRKPLKRLDFKNPAGIELSPDGMTLATGSGDFDDESIRLYDAVTGKFLRKIPNREDRRIFVFSPRQQTPGHRQQEAGRGQPGRGLESLQ